MPADDPERDELLARGDELLAQSRELLDDIDRALARTRGRAGKSEDAGADTPADAHDGRG